MELVSFGGATVDGVRYAAVTERVDRADVRAVQAVAEATGIRVVFFQSEADAQGRYRGGNGFYKDGTVYLDIHAGQNRQGESLKESISTTLTELCVAQNKPYKLSLSIGIGRWHPDMDTKAFILDALDSH